MNNDAKNNQCIYTLETGKHEWNTLHSTGSECGIGYNFCPNCDYVDIKGAIKRASLTKIIKAKFI